MVEAGDRASGLPQPELLCRGWSLLRDRGYLRTAVLPYFRSLSRAPREPADLLRFRRNARRSPRAAWPPLYYRLFRRRDADLFDLFALFSLGAPLRRARWEAILSPAEARLLAEGGFTRLDGDLVRPLVRIFLRGDAVFLHDAPRNGVPLSERGYMARDSLRFADYLERSLAGRSFARALDIGTGCGVQADVLASRAALAVGIERNPRALRFARANALINGRENLRFVRGDLTAPLAGGFDLVVSNPPFIHLPRPLPEGTDPASDGGLLGITVPRRILDRLDRLLAPGGEARILTAVPRELPARRRAERRYGEQRRAERSHAGQRSVGQRFAGQRPADAPEDPLSGFLERNGRHGVLERWIERRLLPRGFEVTLRFVEYLWRDDQLDAYTARGLRTPVLAVAEVRRMDRRRLIVTRAPLPERLILARRLAARRAAPPLRAAAARLSALRPRRAWARAELAVAMIARSGRAPHAPLVLCLEPSSFCPLDCISCARAERIDAAERMDPALLDRLLAETRPEAVRFYGSGEPLDHPEIARFCRRARETGAAVSLQTSLADDAMIARAAEALPFLDRLVVALDAASAGTYAAVRRNGSFSVVAEGLRFLARERARRGLARPALAVSFLILAENAHELSAFARAAFRLGADSALYLTLDGFGIEDRLAALRGALPADALADRLLAAESAAARIGLPTNLGALRRSRILLDYGYTDVPLPRNGPCPRPWVSTFVRVNGDVRPCARYPYGPEGHLGNAAAGSFRAEIWNGPAYRALRRALHGGREGPGRTSARAASAAGEAAPARPVALDFAACRCCPVPLVEGIRLPGRRAAARRTP